MHIVFLHGFLGSPQDLISTAFKLPLKSEMITLPGHGCSDMIPTFENINDWLEDELNSLKIKDYLLYGYSLGGRIALHYALTAKTKKLPKGLILESANIGYNDKNMKQERINNDSTWAEKFRNEPMESVLTQWYEQPIFTDLSVEDREILIKKRSKNNKNRIAKVIENLSLGKMQFLGEKLKYINIPTLYIYGDKDEKFKNIAHKIENYQNPLISVKGISDASHNCHFTNSSTISNLICETFNKV